MRWQSNGEFGSSFISKSIPFFPFLSHFIIPSDPTMGKIENLNKRICAYGSLSCSCGFRFHYVRRFNFQENEEKINAEKPDKNVWDFIWIFYLPGVNHPSIRKSILHSQTKCKFNFGLFLSPLFCSGFFVSHWIDGARKSSCKWTCFFFACRWATLFGEKNVCIRA